MEIYLLADCLLLCDVFDNFRSNCLQQYSIDPCYYFSAPHFTFDAFLRHSLTLELLSDINQYLFIIKGLEEACPWFLRGMHSPITNMWKGIIHPSHQVLFYIWMQLTCMAEPCKHIYLGKF